MTNILSRGASREGECGEAVYLCAQRDTMESESFSRWPQRSGGVRPLSQDLSARSAHRGV